MFADDGSGRESGRTVAELKLKTETMLGEIISGMRFNRLAVNSGKTQCLMFRTLQKKTRMLMRGESATLTLNVEGEKIKEIPSGTLLRD